MRPSVPTNQPPPPPPPGPPVPRFLQPADAIAASAAHRNTNIIRRRMGTSRWLSSTPPLAHASLSVVAVADLVDAEHGAPDVGTRGPGPAGVARHPDLAAVARG